MHQSSTPSLSQTIWLRWSSRQFVTLPKVQTCDFSLFPKLRGCHYETIEEMKEAATKVIDTLTQEDFDGAFQKLLERYNKCIAAGGDYFEGNLSFVCVLSIKVPIRKKSGNLFNDPPIYIYIYVCVCVCVCVVCVWNTFYVTIMVYWIEMHECGNLFDDVVEIDVFD